jgi:hypothetical protein
MMIPDRRDAGPAGDQLAAALAANLATLNEIMAEMTAVVSDDPDFVGLVRQNLRDHSHAIGFEFQGG